MQNTIFLSTLSLRRATQASILLLRIVAISIHALLAESDQNPKEKILSPEQFLSTLSLRRATHCGTLATHTISISIHALLAESDFGTIKTPNPIMHFYPRSPCGERRLLGRVQSFFPWISIHALLAESDLRAGLPLAQSAQISIHALLAESDRPCIQLKTRNLQFLSTLSLRRATLRRLATRARPSNFYPRSPCGERCATSPASSVLN